MLLPAIHSAEDLAALVDEVGFLPFFPCEIPGLSVEECTPPELFFTKDVDGPWEWKGPVIRLSGCAYGKLFRKKAGFVSREWFPDLANYRRDGYDFDARLDEGLVRFGDSRIIHLLEQDGPMISKTLKKKGGYGGRDGLKGFEPSITRLQMQCYVVTSDFSCAKNKYGQEYGWGLARYALPEQVYGADFLEEAYTRAPEESFERMKDFLLKKFPWAREQDAEKLLKP